MQRLMFLIVTGIAGLALVGCAGEDDNLNSAPDKDGDKFRDYGELNFIAAALGLGGDCNDGNSAINPAAAENCDNVDNDCDGKTDVQDDNLVVCNDGNACNNDMCADGLCSTTPKSCNDGNACTNDSCDPALGCATSVVPCDDGNVCTTDSCDPALGCTTTLNTTLCDDVNPCTTDTCNSATGGCEYVNAVCNDGNACTADTCLAETGCTSAPDNAAACSDNDACTVDDFCFNGHCAGGAFFNCDDGNACYDDACINDACVQGSPIACDDGNACTTDACDPALGCTYVNNSAVTCNDGIACTDDSCDQDNGCVHEANNTANCNDGNACTTSDFCFGGACVSGSLVDCFDNDLCTNDSCDPVLGCTMTLIQCVDNKECTNDSCDPSLGCTFMNNTNPCDDGSACTTDACADGECLGTLMSCNDGNPCTVDTCDEADGCKHGLMPNCCVGDVMCADSEPAGLPADFVWGCTVNSGTTTGVCVSCKDADADFWCDSATETDCTNGWDEDGDTLKDCDDPDCDTHPACIPPCVPDCNGKQCGGDGCGGSCGSCAFGDSCTDTFQCETEPRLSITWTAPASGVPQDPDGQLILLAECFDAAGVELVHWGVLANGPTDSTSLTWTATDWSVPSWCRAHVVEIVSGQTVWYSSGLHGVLSYVWDGISVEAVKGNGTSGWPFYPLTDSDGDGAPDTSDPCPMNGLICAIP